MTYCHFPFAQLSYGVWRLAIYSIQVIRTTFMIFLNSWSWTAPVPIHSLQGRKSVAQVSKDTSVSTVFKFRHNWDCNINILLCSGECVYESNGERVKVSLCNPRCCACEGCRTCLWRWWSCIAPSEVVEHTHTHAHKHRICFHKSPVIPLLRAPEKVRQLPPISKRRKNVSVNEYVHVQGQLSGKMPHTCSLCVSSIPVSFSTRVIWPNPSFTPCLPAQVCVYC